MVSGCNFFEDQINSEEQSPTFEVDGQTMHGVEEEFGIVKQNGKENEPEFIASDQGRLYRVYFWSDNDLVGKTYSMEATHTESGTTKELYEWGIDPNDNTSLPGDTHSGAKFGFDEDDAGLWQIDVKVENELYTSFIIEVEEP